MVTISTRVMSLGYVVIITLLFFGLIIKLIIDIIRSIINSKRRKKANLDEKNRLGYVLKGYFLHALGLPVAENANCKVYYFDDKIMIESSGQTFNLAMNKITDISIISDVDIQKSYVSSVGGAVGGALLFGPLGAMVGGRAREKSSTIVKKFLIITFKKDDGLAYAAFKLKEISPSATKMVNLFKNRPNNENKPIDL